MEESVVLAEIYEAGRQLLDDGGRDRTALAGHAFRELMERIPTFGRIEVPPPPQNLKDLVTQLQQQWERALAHVEAGEYKAQSVVKFLKRCREFFERVTADFPARNVRTGMILRHLDAAGAPLPASVESRRVAEWRELNDWFTKLAHHNRIDTPMPTVIERVEELERLLLFYMRPRAFEDYDELDRLIREGEGRA